MNCKTTVGMLSAYLDRELAAGERDAVRTHLADCDRCRTEERDLRALKGLLLGVRAPEPAEDFEQRLLMRLRQEATLPARKRFELPRLTPLAWGQLGGLAAASALATLVLVRGGEPVSETIPPRQTTTVAKNDFDAFADHDMAYAESDDLTAVLMPTNGP